VLKPDLSKVTEILNFFVTVATDNSLHDTPTVQKLQDCLDVINRIDVTNIERTTDEDIICVSRWANWLC